MKSRPLPQYLSASAPTPAEQRAPWYKNTAPAYAGTFLAVIFYLQMASTTLSQAGVALCVLALLVGGLIAFGLFYYAPAMLGMKTGRPLYIVGTSTFGVQGNYLPGLLMGLLQVGFIGVITYFAADFIMLGLHAQSRVAVIGISIVWAYALAWVAMRGIAHVARAGNILNWIPLAMLLIVVYATRGGVAHYQPASHHPASAFALMLDLVLGYFATAGAAGADFGCNNRHRGDVVWGGLVGITLAAVVAGGLALLGVAGAIGVHAALPAGVTSIYDYTAAIASVGALSGVLFFLFVVALLVPTCFCTFIATNSFSTMLPGASRPVWAYACATAGILLAISGAAANLVGFFGLVGACFAPVCGAMTADYWLAGRQWSGPRRGINWAGYLAWIVGCWVGLLASLHLGPVSWQRADHPAVLYSYIAALVVYFVLAQAGLRPALLKETEYGASQVFAGSHS